MGAGLLTLQALSKRVEKFPVTDAEMALPDRFIPEIDTDTFGYPVELTVYLQVFFSTMEYTERSEVISYNLFNWFGDSSAVAGFLTGLTLWAGVSFSQFAKKPVTLID